jgi:hypothetical protein
MTARMYMTSKLMPAGVISVSLSASTIDLGALTIDLGALTINLGAVISTRGVSCWARLTMPGPELDHAQQVRHHRGLIV